MVARFLRNSIYRLFFIQKKTAPEGTRMKLLTQPFLCIRKIKYTVSVDVIKFIFIKKY